MNRYILVLSVLVSLIVSGCDKDEAPITTEIFHGDWKGVSTIELYNLDGTFFRDSKSGFKLELGYGGQGNIIRTSSTKFILWVIESEPDIFLYSELVLEIGSLDFYENYLYEIVHYTNSAADFFKEDRYTENGVEYIRKTFWKLTKE